MEAASTGSFDFAGRMRSSVLCRKGKEGQLRITEGSETVKKRQDGWKT